MEKKIGLILETWKMSTDKKELPQIICQIGRTKERKRKKNKERKNEKEGRSTER
jgi:hypothetical protein